MASGKYILAGLLSGLGKGMESQALYDRELALENLRNQRQIEGETRAENRAIQSETRAEERGNREYKRNQEGQIEILNKSSEIQNSKMDKEFGLRVSFAKFQADLADRSAARSAAQQERMEMIRQQYESGNVSDIRVDGDGNYVAFDKRGRPITSNVKAKQDPLTDSQVEGQKKLNREAQKAKTFTKADVTSTAKKYGISEAEVYKQMQAAGYRLAQ